MEEITCPKCDSPVSISSRYSFYIPKIQGAYCRQCKSFLRIKAQIEIVPNEETVEWSDKEIELLKKIAHLNAEVIYNDFLANNLYKSEYRIKKKIKEISDTFPQDIKDKIYQKEHPVLPPLPIYPKFAQPPKCKHPERSDCNYGEGYKRCEFMKFVRVGNWKCDA